MQITKYKTIDVPEGKSQDDYIDEEALNSVDPMNSDILTIRQDQYDSRFAKTSKLSIVTPRSKQFTSTNAGT